MQIGDITLDPFQEQAITLTRQGHSVLVAAPTGTGKTIIADQVVQQALSEGRSVIYTAPVKALSNQKFRDYCREHGDNNVGLVTGDLVIRRDAPCLVMTTEILRNMLLDSEGGPPANLAAVILDEIHFLDDRDRGTVWEEVLIYLSPEVRVIGLSATLSNLDEFAAWLGKVRGEKVHVVRETERAVPLQVFLANKELGIVTPDAYEKAWKVHKKKNPPEERSRGRRGQRGGKGGRGKRSRAVATRHTDVVFSVGSKLSPILYFVFSRRLAEDFARTLSNQRRYSMLPQDTQARADKAVDDALLELGSGVLDRELERMYRKGIAFHHAGLHVQLKTLVEQLYERKLISVLYTTSTFALGINMPARTVILDGLHKYDGRGTNPLTVRQFMQKAGRAGRRGMDKEGTVVVRMDFDSYPESRPQLPAYLAGASEPVNSSFNLSFNSVVCLLERHKRTKVRDIVERSFLSFRIAQQTLKQQDRVVELETELTDMGFDVSGAGPKPAKKQHKARKLSRDLTRLRKRLQTADQRVWLDFERRRQFLVEINYLGDDDELLAGGRMLQHLRIEEILATELALSGLVDEMEPDLLFGVLCGMTNNLPSRVKVFSSAGNDARKVAGRITQLRNSRPVTGAEAITGVEVTWDPQMILFGRRWARGSTLEELQLLYSSNSDLAGQLVGGFRRAKDMASQLYEVFREDPHTADMLKDLTRRVARDEVEVIG